MEADRVVRIIKDYIEECIPEPSIDQLAEGSGTCTRFSINSYSRWAANEILSRYLKEADRLPEHISGQEEVSIQDVIRSFIDELDNYLDTTTNFGSTFIFLTARNTACEIGCRFAYPTE